MSEETTAPATDSAPQNKLFVGNLSWSTTNDSLKAAFEEFGTVESAEVVTDRMTGRSKGFGFVVMSSAEEAAAAVEKLNGQMLDSRPVTVNVARPKTDRPSSDRRGGDRGFGHAA